MSNRPNVLSYSLLFLLFVLSATNSFAIKEDKISQLYTDPQLTELFNQSEKLKNTTLLVIIDDAKSASGKKLIASMDKTWKFNKYRITKGDSVDHWIKDPRYSLLSIYSSDNKKGDALGYSLGIFIGDPKNKEFDSAEDFMSISFPGAAKANAKQDSILKENSYLFGFFVKYLHGEVLRANQKSNVKVTSSSDLCTYYDEGKELLKNKTVLVCQSGIDSKFNPKNFAKNFNVKPEQLKLVDKKEIENAINKANDKIAFAYEFKGGKGRIYDASNGAFLAEGIAKSSLISKLAAYSIIPLFAGVIALLFLSGYK